MAAEEAEKSAAKIIQGEKSGVIGLILTSRLCETPLQDRYLGIRVCWFLTQAALRDPWWKLCARSGHFTPLLMWPKSVCHYRFT